MFKRLLARASLTQQELANRLNVSQPLVNAWVKGKSRPTINRVREIAEILNATVEEILACFTKAED